MAHFIRLMGNTRANTFLSLGTQIIILNIFRGLHHKSTDVKALSLMESERCMPEMVGANKPSPRPQVRRIKLFLQVEK